MGNKYTSENTERKDQNIEIINEERGLWERLEHLHVTLQSIEELQGKAIFALDESLYKGHICVSTLREKGSKVQSENMFLPNLVLKPTLLGPISKSLDYHNISSSFLKGVATFTSSLESSLGLVHIAI